MKRFLLVGLLITLMIAGFSQNYKGDKLFALSEVYSSDDIEYNKYAYNDDMLLQTTNSLSENGDYLIDSLWYDEFNNIVKLDLYQLLNGAWTYVSYIDYTYDENGNRLTRSNYNSYGTPNFTLGGIYKYYYDENNKQTNWELYMGGTDLMQICTLTYNEAGQVVMEIGQDNFNSGNMENSWKIDYQYNSDGTLKTTAQSFWSGYWSVYGTELFYYDNDKNCIKWDHKDGNTVTNRREYEYNMAYTADQLVLPVEPEFDTEDLIAMNNMATVQHWYTEDNVGILVYVCDYIYDYDTLTSVGIASPAFDAANLRVFPNPASDLITIAANNTIISNAEILDNTGKVVLRNSNLNKEKVNLDLSTLKPGVYFVRLATSKGVFMEKLIVQ